MMNQRHISTRRPLQATLLGAAFGLIVTGALAGQTAGFAANNPGFGSQWAKSHYSQARLITGQTALPKSGAAAKLGVEIKLQPGWKTYWRTPGDSGVPPLFSWKGSQNLKSVKILWPAPVWFRDEFGTSIGYKKQIVFPIEAEPIDAAKPMSVKLTLGYAACKDICVPVQAEMALTLPAGFAISTPHATTISKFTSRVPQTKLSADTAPVIVAREVKLPKPSLIIDLNRVRQTGKVELFVEGPKKFYFGRPEPVAAKENAQLRYRIPVDAPDGEQSLKGAQLRVTLSDGAAASEHLVPVK